MPQLATSCLACGSPSLDRQPAILMPFVAERALGWSPVEITAAWGLRDIPTGWAQAICCTLHCPCCEMVFLDMRFDAAEMQRLYRDYRGSSYEEQRERHEPGYASRNQNLLKGDPHIEAVEQILSPWLPAHPTILDWGGDTGVNTPLRKRARLHHVLDISGRELVPGAQALSSDEELTVSYDLIVLSNVLEHLPSPDSLLATIAQSMGRMDQPARLYVEVPLEPLMQALRTDRSAWLAKRHWHEHINFFSEKALFSLLQRAGFRILKTQEMRCRGDAMQLGLVCELDRSPGIS